MQQQRYAGVLFLILLVTGSLGQDETTVTSSGNTSPTPMESTTTWHGDQSLCPNGQMTTTAVPQKPMPDFPTQAEFAIEQIRYEQILGVSIPVQTAITQYIYDYRSNVQIVVANENGALTETYFYYGALKKATYLGGTICVVKPINVSVDTDGSSAIILPDGTPHIRPLNEFLLFSNLNQTPPIIPTYLGTNVVRGIPVDVWQSCYYNATEYRTVRRIWSFAASTFNTPFGNIGNQAFPVEGLVTETISIPGIPVRTEVDDVYNVYSYRPFITESNSDLSPPKGVFCPFSTQVLGNLSDFKVGWPNHFSVRVEASSTRTNRWQRFHLRYNLGRDNTSRLLRYDYIPPGAEDFKSVIHDYANRLTYAIDRRTGQCQISRTVDYPDVSPIRDPIEFFIKHEAMLIFDPPTQAWEFNGYRACRGNTIRCTIITGQFDSFPVMVDSDTGRPSGENWTTTNIEYGWSWRDPPAQLSPDIKPLDYPVSITMKLIRFADPLAPSLANIRSEDIEYEFYEMSEDRTPYDFDISSCYRANNYEYFHVFFLLKLNKDNVLDSENLNPRSLERRVVITVLEKAQVKYSRIADVEIEHERKGNDVTVFLTILGPTRVPETDSYATDEPTTAQARDNLKQAIDNGEFKFDLQLNDGSTVQFLADVGSLKASTQYMSTHSQGTKNITESYSSGYQALAICVGLLIGLIVGVAVAFIIRKVRGQPVPKMPGAITNPIPSVSFRGKRNDGDTTTA